MTKIIILGDNTPKQPKKPIEFLLSFNENKTFIKPHLNPKHWQNIELVCRNYNYERVDLMFAYNENRNLGVLYLGHFNDGIV